MKIQEGGLGRISPGSHFLAGRQMWEGGACLPQAYSAPLQGLSAFLLLVRGPACAGSFMTPCKACLQAPPVVATTAPRPE